MSLFQRHPNARNATLARASYCEPALTLKLVIFGMETFLIWFRTKWVKESVWHYIPKGYSCSYEFHYDMPVFGQIFTVILHESTQPLLITNLLQTLCFNKHFFAYEVKETTTRSYYVCRQSDLADYHPLSIYTPQNSSLLLIPLKYYVLSDFDL